MDEQPGSLGAAREVENLIELMAKLPGLGRRSARRAVLQMVNKRESLMEPMSKLMVDVCQKVRRCDLCGNIAVESICNICSNPRRDPSKLCVVADVSDLWAMERANTFNGCFYVLGGILSALDGVGPEDLNIPKLINRIKTDPINEIILALGATINGQTTAHYIADQLTNADVEITSLAHGMPIGGELDYLDEGTIEVAFRHRKEF
jgi:recombination protein RecR